jgi:glycosyltransferase involved in cell wall biosynthesis
MIDQNTLLLIVGNRDPETATIRALIKQRSLAARVKFVDRVTDGELKWLYENCEVLIVPSMEGFGLPIVEGLFCGSRFVCSDIPAFREVGGDACHYFEPHAKSDSSAMVEAICNELREPAGPAKRLDRFLPKKIAKE